MASTIVTKNSSTASAVPLTGDLTQGELAVNVTDKRLFTKNSGGTVVELGTNPASLALPNGTANGVAYLNGSKVLTTGSALTFDGTNTFTVATSVPTIAINGTAASGTGARGIDFQYNGASYGDIRLNVNSGELEIVSGQTGQSGYFQTFKINGSEQMRLTSTGLGIGTSSPTAKLEVSGSSPTARITAAQNTVATLRLSQTNVGNCDIYVPATTSNLAFSTNAGSTQHMTLDASGRLALGATSILGGSNIASFTNVTSAKGVLAIQNTSTSGYSAVELYDNAGSQQGAMGWGNGSVAVTGAASATYLYSTGAITFLSGGTTERARIDSSGNLLVGTTSNSATGGIVHAQSATNSTALGAYAKGTTSSAVGYYCKVDSSNALYAYWNCNGVNTGTISTNGTTTAYNTTSDYRLKENIAPMTGALATVVQLKPVTYTWKTNGVSSQGFIAHELQTVVPDCVTGEKDAVDEEGNPKYQGIDTSFLVATLTAAIQEQQALIQTLTERITALEGK